MIRGGQRKEIVVWRQEREKTIAARGRRKRNFNSEAGERKLLFVKRNCCSEVEEKIFKKDNRIGPDIVTAVEGAGGCGRKKFCREPINLLNMNTLRWVACRYCHDTRN